MKTGKKLLALALVLIIMASFAGCGGQRSAENAAYDMAAPEAPAEQPAPDPESEAYSYPEKAEENTVALEEQAPSQAAPGDKIVYSGYVRVETMEFDAGIEKLEQMVSDCGGFIQFSDVTGTDFNSMHSGSVFYRYANYTLRIPAGKFSSFNQGLAQIGNIPYSSSNAENITMQYTDTAARLTARQAEETRLLELLSKAETVEEMLSIESYLGDVRCQIESLSSQIKYWDSAVSYSTLNVEIQEVSLYTESTPATLSYGEQLKEGFSATLRGMGHFFKGLLKFIVSASPVIVILAVVAVAVVLIVRRGKKSKKAAASSGEVKKDE